MNETKRVLPKQYDSFLFLGCWMETLDAIRELYGDTIAKQFAWNIMLIGTGNEAKDDIPLLDSLLNGIIKKTIQEGKKKHQAKWQYFDIRILEDEIKSNPLYSKIIYEAPKRPGVYAILVDNKVAYIGESNNMAQRIITHLFGILYPQKLELTPTNRKYDLLYQALNNGYDLRITVIKDTKDKDEKFRKNLEEKLIEELKPPLNIKYRGRFDYSVMNMDLQELDLRLTKFIEDIKDE